MESWQFRIQVLILILCAFLLQGCAKPRTYNPLPENLQHQAAVPGFKNCRGWGNEHSQVLVNSMLQAIEQEKAAKSSSNISKSALVLSGGGQEGAFGAGLLCGWTKAGTRPNFKLVTGISVGAMIAPLAFLGPEYDAVLEEAFTTVTKKDVYEEYSIFSIILATLNITSLSSLADNEPLARTINRYADERMLNKIADEHLKGRRLFIGTGQMNAERLAIWDMGAIATRRTPEALALFRKILLAAVSIPDFFPPAEFQVEAGGKIFTEIHVDGGNDRQLFLYGATKPPDKFISDIYIIRNVKVDPEWKHVELKLSDIASRSLGSITKSQGIGDLYRIYTYSSRDDTGYHLAYIPAMFKEESKEHIDREYMGHLFKLGYKMGRLHEKWRQYPPFYHPEHSIKSSTQKNR